MSPGSGQTVDFDESVQGDLVGGVEIATKMTSSGAKIKLWETERNQKCDTIPLFGIPYHSEKNQKNTKYRYKTGKSKTLSRSPGGTATSGSWHLLGRAALDRVASEWRGNAERE